ncbi:hypothetical protein MKW98_025770 [Papaver atlanticum]|uniref:Thioredoxin domain-containing protein n=1 Tax=Papaver atlanticum TaxID=357466 RepID=A0AAD4XBE7_9MAGN|nr:hypothetical protein MKW98_025770 [Papaver atlanticum]
MQIQNVFHPVLSLNYGKAPNGQFGAVCTLPSVAHHANFLLVEARVHYLTNHINLHSLKINSSFLERKSVMDENQGELSDEDDELCPVECVKEFKTDDELFTILERAKKDSSLVVVDFYRTSCGSCKYIEQGFSKLCKGSGKKDAPVIFLKHNVMDEYDEQSETADRLRIKAVPLFHFYKDGVLLEKFATRDKERILAAIRKYSSADI